VDQRHCLLVQLLLVEELVLDRVQVDEVAHACAHVPANIVRVHVHLPEELDHLILVRGVRLCARGRRCEVRCVVLVVIVVAIAVLCGYIDSGERECVGNLKSTIYIHAHERASRWCRKGRTAVFDHFENDLRGVSGVTKAMGCATYECFNLHRLDRGILEWVCHVCELWMYGVRCG
jgi:hypothetical protein